MSIIYDTDSTTPSNAIISSAVGGRNYYLTHYTYATGQINWALDPGASGGNTIEFQSVFVFSSVTYYYGCGETSNNNAYYMRFIINGATAPTASNA